MRVTVVGTGYVGLVVGACLAESGNVVTCADKDAAKIDGLKDCILPIFEPGLQELVEANQKRGRLSFTTDTGDAVRGASVVFIAVGTPPDEDGSADVSHVLQVASDIGPYLSPNAVIVTKSTVPVGTTRRVQVIAADGAAVRFHVCNNPEFLREGAAVRDYLRPDRIIVGSDSEHVRAVMDQLYEPFVRPGRPVLHMDIASAELTKYVANAMLATRIAFMNEVARLCEHVSADVDCVRRGVGSDPRIGPHCLLPGPGYGGSCLPKDVKAMIRIAGESGSPLRILKAVNDSNEHQKGLLFEKTVAALGGNVRRRRICVWGLAFKPMTDDTRESPALVLIDQLVAAGASVAVHDPAAMDEARLRLGMRVRYGSDSMDAARGADAVVIATEWKEYSKVSFEHLRALMRHPIIIDGRNLLNPQVVRELGFDYFSLGRGGPPRVVHHRSRELQLSLQGERTAGATAH